ncbi:mitotic spindle assembly checkpoint protein MAD1-like isoform X3 [Malurus melanocephalus]|uniref:mitotic spindle assembly checkpoint protein MAD1-like isoform X3 n=1 Tax=Malurus melanocephalus TaxID=175006 RepID=UPI0025483C4A|nr:mitotic spindle assembly checkpoint protein MAD1-like isoform X3 [Malurus melanocephalus]
MSLLNKLRLTPSSLRSVLPASQRLLTEQTPLDAWSLQILVKLGWELPLRHCWNFQTLPAVQGAGELKKQVESAELKNQRLKEVFQTKIQEFRKVCYTLTGYQIDITTENQYRLSSIYAEHQGDCLLFKVESTSRGSI